MLPHLCEQECAASVGAKEHLAGEIEEGNLSPYTNSPQVTSHAGVLLSCFFGVFTAPRAYFY